MELSKSHLFRPLLQAGKLKSDTVTPNVSTSRTPVKHTPWTFHGSPAQHRAQSWDVFNKQQLGIIFTDPRFRFSDALHRSVVKATKPIQTDKLLIISDWTKTLGYQRDSNALSPKDQFGLTLYTHPEIDFPDEVRDTLSALLKQGAELIVTTSDDLATVSRHLLTHLPEDFPKFTILTSCGNDGFQWQGNGKIQPLFSGKSFSPAQINTFIDRIENSIHKTINPDFQFSEAQRKAFQMGGRAESVSVSPEKPRLKYNFTLGPTRFSLYAVCYEHLSPEERQLSETFLKSITKDPVISNIVDEHAFSLEEFPESVEVSIMTKSQGLKQFFAHILPGMETPLFSDRKHVALFGDSVNDIGLFTGDYLHHLDHETTVQGFFIGPQKDVFEACNKNNQVLHLPGYTDSTARVFYYLDHKNTF